MLETSPGPTVPGVPTEFEKIAAKLAGAVAEILGLETGEIDPDTALADFGLSSEDAVSLSGDLEEWLGIRVPPTIVWDHPTITSLARYMSERRSEVAVEPSSDEGMLHNDQFGQASDTREPIAIIGIGCRLPGGVDDVDSLWRMLKVGVDTIGEPGDQRRRSFDSIGAQRAGSPKLKGGFLDQVDGFDAGFFRLSDREADQMDPQQRLMLEVTWEAVDDAGLTAEELEGSRTGVFVGISSLDYMTLAAKAPIGEPDPFSVTGAVHSIAANRISYLLGLRGPSIAVDTACSSSLVALHLACQSLHAGDCDAAVVGGVNVILNPEINAAFERGGLLSPDARCKSFDHRADGYVRGEGAVAILIRPLSVALAAGDHVYGLVLGSAMNNDGPSNGLTAPSGAAQEMLLRDAYRRARVDPCDVAFVEAHGTGTALGDPIEAGALGAVVGRGREGSPVWIGSIKSNIGHLEAAAGLAGLLKACLALRYQSLPASLHYKEANPHIPFEELNLRVASEYCRLDAEEPAVVAGVSSFGFGGTNAHVVLGASAHTVPSTAQDEVGDVVALIPLSAHSESSLRELAERYAAFLLDKETSLLDVAFTAGVRRTKYSRRLAVWGRNRDEVCRRLASFAAGEPASGCCADSVPRSGRKLAFVYSGQGGQWQGMGVELYAREPVFREILDQCAAVYNSHVEGPSLIHELHADAESSRLADTAIAQPMIFAVQLGLTGLWRSWGVEPAAVVGHSVGEVAAACAAGVLTAAAGMRVVIERARAMDGLRGRGGMVSLDLTVADVEARLAGWSESLGVAAINGPRSVVVSGDAGALSKWVAEQESTGISCQRVRVEYGFHSAQMCGASERVSKSLADLSPSSESLPLYSTVTGGQLDGELWDASYWSRNVREPVRLQTAVESLADDGFDAFLEIGGHPILHRNLVEVLAPHSRSRPGPSCAVGMSLRRNRPERSTLLESLGRLWCAGVAVDWRAVVDNGGRCVSLPNYPWDRKRHWVTEAVPDLPGSEWLYRVDWQVAPLQAPESVRADGDWLLICDGLEGHGGSDESTLFANLRSRLTAAGANCVIVSPAKTFEVIEPDRYRIDMDAPEDYLRVVDEAFVGGRRACAGVVQLLGDGGFASEPDARFSIRGLYAVQAFASVGFRDAPRVWWVTREATALADGDEIDAGCAGLSGLAKVMGHEHPELHLTRIDVEASSCCAEMLLWELTSSDAEREIVHRRGVRYRARLVASPDAMCETPAPISATGTYLVTGGIGGLGLRVAEGLVTLGARRLVLASRRGIASEAETNAQIEAIREAGAQVEVVALDVSNASAVEAQLQDIRASGWPLRGIVHAAGVIDDGIVLHQDAVRMRRVWAAKAKGAWNLHRASEGDALDFFVLFSSVAALLGSPGQANYAAANAGMDGVAAHRRARGLTATCIHWGPWAEVGMAAQLGFRGLGAVPPDTAVSLFTRLIHSEQTQVGVVDLNLRRWLESYPAAARLGFLDQLKEAGSSMQRESQTASAIAGADTPEELRQILFDELREQVAIVMGSLAPDINPEEPFKQMGFDSLMALELRNRLEASLGILMPVTLLFAHPTMASLVPRLALLVRGDRITEEPSPVAALEDFAELTDEQARELLREELASLPDEWLQS